MMNKKSGKKRQQILAAVISATLSASLCGIAPVYATPAFFDWRLENPTDRNSGTASVSIISPVRDQSALSTCWSFAAFSSYESSYMKQLMAAKAAGENVTVANPDFSERYLVWMSNKTATNETTTDRVMRYGRTFPYKFGGAPYQALTTFINKGAVLESEAPYSELLEPALSEYNTKVANGVNVIDAYIAFNKVVTENATNPNFGSIASTISPTGGLHDVYAVLKNYNGGALTAKQIEKLKEFIRENGAVEASHNADDQSYYTAGRGEWYSTAKTATHAEALVGWDDDYVFDKKGANGETLRGAFIMRNNWGTYALGSEVGRAGYGYISYQDESLGSCMSGSGFQFYNADLDAKRYTINANHAPVPLYQRIATTASGENITKQPVAATFKATQDHFLKGVMIFSSSDNMKYNIKIREGEIPGTGKILYEQNGQFGSDGTPKYAGFRTVDLDKYVLIPDGKKYLVEVTPETTDGSAVGMYFMPSSNYSHDSYGHTYYYDYDEKTWKKSIEMDAETLPTNSAVNYLGGDTNVSPATGYNVIEEPEEKYTPNIFLVARGKETNLAGGEDFTVSYLDDTDSNHTSVINLGSANENYGYDAAHPNRKTLSNMTVDLESGVVNTYGGTIIGEGGVTKTGAGSLALTGANTYTGLTNVNQGVLAINGSVAGDVTVTNAGILSGSGSVGGNLNNKNIVVAGYGGQGSLTVGNLDGDGGKFISVANGTDNTKINVQGTANIANATFQVANAMPDTDYEVLNAPTVTGNAANGSGNPTAVSGMMSQYGESVNNGLKVKSVFADNLGDASSEERKTMGAMNAMYRNLDATKREEMRTLYNLDASEAKTALSQIGSSPAPVAFSLAQQSTIVSQVIGDRLNTAFATATINVPMPVSRFADEPENDKNSEITIPMELPMATDNNAWVKFTKHWGDMKSGANYHGQAISGGYDHAVGNYRIGTFISYNSMGYGAESAGGNIYDTRFGFYGVYHKGARDAYIYLDYGWQKNKLSRGLMGMTASADYDSHLIELGGEYKYDLHADDGKIWHISPYAGLQLSYLRHNGYNETGAGIFNQRVAGENNTYFAVQTGVEFKRYLNRGSYGMRVGVKHAFSGADPNLSFHYEGDAQNRYTLRNSQDKTHFLLSLSADTEFAPGWQIAGDAMLQKGGHDKDLSASITLRRMW